VSFTLKALIIFRRVNKLALNIATEVRKVRLASVSGNVWPYGVAAFQAFKNKRPSVFRFCSFPDCQRFFNSDDVTKKFTLGCDRHYYSPLTNLVSIFA
jgi:hypothetical protein